MHYGTSSRILKPRWVWCIIVDEENVKLVVLRLKTK